MKTTANVHPSLAERADPYREPDYLNRLSLMLHGLRRPYETRDYKAAIIELQRLSAPLSAVILPAVLIGLILLLSDNTSIEDPIISIVVMEPDNPGTELQKPLAVENKEAVIENDDVIQAIPLSPIISVKTETVQYRVTPAPPPIAAKIPDNMNLFMPGSLTVIRNANTRDRLRVANDGDQITEDAVMRSLRWLKKNQQDDGSWRSQRVAMTGLAVLTFLAHGERPGDSPEFGESVQHALEYLLKNQKSNGHFNNIDGNEYAHPIATYALCEAYGMTLNPNVKAAALKALIPIIQGQHPTGGWTYGMNPDPDPVSGKYRDDTSYMGWCAQALKAAKLADIHANGLDKAIKLAVKGFKNNATPNGGFGYVSPGTGGLTGVGTLCMQLLGASTASEVKKSLDMMEDWTPSFDQKGAIGESLQYYCYYATQAKFHSGGKRWENWNRMMKPAYVKSQQIEKNAIADETGRKCDIGWWTNGDKHTDRPVMDTCLAALQLMVYYRYLPTTGKSAVRANDTLVATTTDTGDIIVDSGNL